MKVVINTKSNFRNLNGKALEVKEVVDNRVSCLVEDPELGTITVDFTIEEVIFPETHKLQKSKLGNTTGSFVNWLYGNNMTAPEVGKGATILHWTDRDAYEVLEVSPDYKTVIIQRYKEKRLDSAIGDSQRYLYNELEGPKITLVWRQNAWRTVAEVIVFDKKFYTARQAEENKRGRMFVQWTEEEREELWAGGTHLRLIEGKTKLKKEYSKVNIIFGVKDQYFDYSF